MNINCSKKLVATLSETSIEEYERKLDILVRKREVKCRRCDNREDFMVNELGHVFCNKCYSKIPNIRL
jgi:Zn finger protein HypA/HybF involved in hydrogenase expression